MKIKWLGHSCFVIESQGHKLVIDPFEPGAEPGLSDVCETADVVVVSHEHFDHNYRAGVSLRGGSGGECFRVVSYTVAHDDKGGALRGMTDINVIFCEGLRVVHFGDIGCSLPSSLVDVLSGADCVMVPVGGFYTIDGKAAADMVKLLAPVVAVPMHYRSEKFGFPELSLVSDFTSEFSNVIMLSGNTFELGGDMEGPTRIVVPSLG